MELNNDFGFKSINQKILLTFIFWFFCEVSWSQELEKIEGKDSTKIYKEIETISKKNKYLKFIHSLIFKPVSPVPKKQKKNLKKADKSFKIADKKIIRDIEIITLDPFGFDISDTTVEPKNFLARFGNKAHIKSRKITISNLLLFKKNEAFDSLVVKESERLIRSQNYVRDVRITVNMARTKPDSVDIKVVVLDLWSISANGSLSPSKFGLSVTDRNFAGLGYQLYNAVTKEASHSNVSFETNYFINNIRNSFINSNLHYKVNQDNSYLMRFQVDRSFYSSFAQYAGGVVFEQQYNTDSLLFKENSFKFQNIRFNTQDFWLGKAWPFQTDYTDYSRATNIILAARYLRRFYLDRPDTSFIQSHEFAHENFLLLSIGLNTRIFLQDRYLFNYGLPEDVPTGKLYNFTFGFQTLNGQARLYTGIKLAWGDYFKWGYFSNFLEYGTFIKKARPEQGVVKNEITYFTELFSLGKWNFRQFVKPSVLIGLHRFSNDRIYIRNDSTSASVLFDPKESFWVGQHRFMITLQTQSYAPWHLYGFRFGPFFSLSFIFLGKQHFSFQETKLFTQIDLGILIKNEFLLFNYFQISFSFNPIFPGGRKNVFRFNAYETTDFRLSGFESNKPGPTIYR